LRLGGYRGGADKQLNSKRLAVNLDTLERVGGLDSLLRLVEDDSSASQALAVRSILKQNLAGLADIDNCVEVFLQGALVVVADEQLRTRRASCASPGQLFVVGSGSYSEGECRVALKADRTPDITVTFFTARRRRRQQGALCARREHMLSVYDSHARNAWPSPTGTR
jgi:hypothetical protein